MISSFQSINSKIKDYVVIIAKRIHLFPFRTQKLSSLALMVLGGQLPGRVRRSHVIFFYVQVNYIVIDIMDNL